MDNTPTKTAMGHLIDEIDYAIGRRNVLNEIERFSIEVLRIVKEQATELLEKEKTQIEDAYKKGKDDWKSEKMDDVGRTSLDFFIQTYKQ